MENISFKNEALQKAVEVAKAGGLKVFAFQQGPIGQVFVTDDSNIGSIHARFGTGAIDLLSVHKPCKEAGTAILINRDNLYDCTIEEIKATFTCIPNWASQYFPFIRKYKSWEEYISKSNLNYYEI